MVNFGTDMHSRTPEAVKELMEVVTLVPHKAVLLYKFVFIR